MAPSPCLTIRQNLRQERERFPLESSAIGGLVAFPHEAGCKRPAEIQHGRELPPLISRPVCLACFSGCSLGAIRMAPISAAGALQPVLPRQVFPRQVFPRPVFPRPVFPRPVFPRPVFPRPVFPRPVWPRPVWKGRLRALVQWDMLTSFVCRSAGHRRSHARSALRLVASLRPDSLPGEAQPP